MRYLPFLDGKYSTAPGLSPLTRSNGKDRQVFQLDEQYAHYIRNKEECRKEDIHKYYCESNLYPHTIEKVNRLIATTLAQECPGDFTLNENGTQHTLFNRRTLEILKWEPDWITLREGPYLSLFDALCCQVQEDLAICQLEGEKDWLAAIHLSAPNHWAPSDKIGHPFSIVHGPVPGMERLNQQYFKMLVSAVQKGPFSRFAWGVSTDCRLNHHPIPPPGIHPDNWYGRKIKDSNAALYIRTERQTLVGIPEANAFLFTIRTYFYDTKDLTPDEKTALLAAIDSMSLQSLEYKGLAGQVEALKQRLEND